MSDELETPRFPWPMVALIVLLIAAGIALTYALIWTPIVGYDNHFFGHRSSGYAIMLCLAPFAAAVAAIRAIREEAADRRRRLVEAHIGRKVDKREKIAPFPAEPVVRGVDNGPFRSAPGPAPIVARTHAPVAAAPVQVVPGAGEPPKLLT